MFSYTKALYQLNIVFPNKQYGGVYALGPLIIYNMVNQRKNWYCERVFLDAGKITAPLVGFTLQYELDVPKALAMKPKNGITFAGGPLVQMYPDILAEHFDFLLLGDVEAVLDKVLDAYEEDKENFLARIRDIDGVFMTGRTKKTFPTIPIDDAPYPIVQPFPHTLDDQYVFGKCFLLEIERGCPFICKFCAIPVFYNEKLQFRSLENLTHIIDQGLAINKVNKVVIYAPSFVHPQRKEILRYLLKKKVRVSVPSVKAEHIDIETLQLIKACGQESITIAPECGQRLRFALNKKVPDQAYFDFVCRCNDAEIQKLKLYLMIGLPGMTQEDLEELVTFVKEMQHAFHGTLYLSLNTFVPKPGTPLENFYFDKKTAEKQALFLRKNLKGLRMKITSSSSSYKEGTLLRKQITSSSKFLT